MWYQEQTVQSSSVRLTLKPMISYHNQPFVHSNNWNWKPHRSPGLKFSDLKPGWDVSTWVWVRLTTQHATDHLRHMITPSTVCGAALGLMKLGLSNKSTNNWSLLHILLPTFSFFCFFCLIVSDPSASNEIFWEITNLFNFCEGRREKGTASPQVPIKFPDTQDPFLGENVLHNYILVLAE